MCGCAANFDIKITRRKIIADRSPTCDWTEREQDDLQETLDGLAEKAAEKHCKKGDCPDSEECLPYNTDTTYVYDSESKTHNGQQICVLEGTINAKGSCECGGKPPEEEVNLEPQQEKPQQEKPKQEKI